MLNWKILAVSVVALLVITTVLLGGFGLKGTLSDVGGKLSDLLKSSPFGGFFSVPSNAKEVSVFLSPKQFSLKPDSTVNLNVASIGFSEFNGEINIDFENKTVILVESGSNLKINTELKNMSIERLKINKLVVSDIKFRISNITTDNGTIEISGFIGIGKINPNGIELAGNVSSLKTRIGDQEWELR